jgi:hypothetical protein
MPTLEMAKKKWANKVKGSKWKAGVTGKEDAYCDGIARFLGIRSCNPELRKAWADGVDMVSARDFDEAVHGKEERWASRYSEKAGGVRKAKEEY